LIYSKKSLPRVSWRRRSKDACAEQNFDYCSKDGDFYEIGEPNKQGARNDLKKLAAEITVNNLEEVARNNREAYINTIGGYTPFHCLYKNTETKRLKSTGCGDPQALARPDTAWKNILGIFILNLKVNGGTGMSNNKQ